MTRTTSITSRITMFLAFPSVANVVLLIIPVVTSQETTSLSSYCQLWNAALCRPSYISSTYHSTPVELAVDGNRNEQYYGGSCIHTLEETNNWWMVDLGNDFMVHRVIITNRADNREWAIKPITIDTFLTDPRNDPIFPANTNGVHCTNITDTFLGTKTFDCQTPSYARYIKVWKSIKGIITMCEMEVMVSRKQGDPDCHKTKSRDFNIHLDTTVRRAVDVEIQTVAHRLACLNLCLIRGDHFCDGFYWTERTKSCQMLSVNPYETGSAINTPGTDFYVTAPISCVGDGVWEMTSL